jgi:hypothetical protein
VKANEALLQSSRIGSRKQTSGGKRKGPKSAIPKSKRGRETTQEATRPFEGEGKQANGQREDEPKAEQAQLGQEPTSDETQRPVVKGENDNAKEPLSKSSVTESKGKKALSQGSRTKESQEPGAPSPVDSLEKGIIYFFVRGRVGVDQPESTDEVARTFIILRPLRAETLDKGSSSDDKCCRLLVIPKKILPTSPRERVMGFVEKAGASVQALRDSFLPSEYETKTKGTQHAPAATPVAEGAYTITSHARTSRLAYLITVPPKLGEVQRDFGLKSKGSFIVSAKNPKYPGPPTAQLPKGPDYPKE